MRFLISFFFCISFFSYLVRFLIGPLTEISGLFSQFFLFFFSFDPCLGHDYSLSLSLSLSASLRYKRRHVLIGLVRVCVKDRNDREKKKRKGLEAFSCSPNYRQISFSRFFLLLHFPILFSFLSLILSRSRMLTN